MQVLFTYTVEANDICGYVKTTCTLSKTDLNVQSLYLDVYFEVKRILHALFISTVKRYLCTMIEKELYTARGHNSGLQLWIRLRER